MRTVACAALLFLLSACQTPPPEMTDAERAEIEAGVLAVSDAWMETWRGNDCAMSRGQWHPEYFAEPRVGRIDLTVDDWIRECSATMTNRASFDGEWTERVVRIISPDAALLEGTYWGTYTYRDGSPGRHYPQASQVFLMERAPTGWGITFFVNANGPAEETAAEPEG